MALIAHQTQGSFSTYSLRAKASTSWVKQRSSLAVQFIFSRTEFSQLKHQWQFRCEPIICPKMISFKVASFKGNARNDEPEGREAGPKFSKSSVQLSCTNQGREETLSDTYGAKKNSLSYASNDSEETVAKSLAIQKLFRKWLLMLRTQTFTRTIDGNVSEKTYQNASSECQHAQVPVEKENILRAALVYFSGLDAAILVPLMIFIPGYLTVRLLYGAEVTKELMPLWTIGPLIISFYVKILQGLCLLYRFLFMQAFTLVKNLPTYSMVVYSCIAEGKLKAFLWTCFWKPIINIKNLDYRAFVIQKYKQLEAWVVEKYLDYVESIWPYYCRTIRFLKKAHLL